MFFLSSGRTTHRTSRLSAPNWRDFCWMTSRTISTPGPTRVKIKRQQTLPTAHHRQICLTAIRHHLVSTTLFYIVVTFKAKGRTQKMRKFKLIFLFSVSTTKASNNRVNDDVETSASCHQRTHHSRGRSLPEWSFLEAKFYDDHNRRKSWHKRS